MKKIFIILVIFLLIIPNLKARETKSKILAGLLSFAVPGAGEFYSENTSSALISLTSETLLWISYFGFKQQAKWAENDYKMYANAYSGAHTVDGSEEYYENLQHYYTSDEYNNNVFIYARWGLNYNNWTELEYETFLENNLYSGDFAWCWKDEDVWRKYGDLRREKNKFKIIAKFTVGAMVVNRIISVIKAVHSVNVFNKRIQMKKNISFHFSYNPILKKSTVYIQKCF